MYIQALYHKNGAMASGDIQKGAKKRKIICAKPLDRVAAGIKRPPHEDGVVVKSAYGLFGGLQDMKSGFDFAKIKIQSFCEVSHLAISTIRIPSTWLSGCFVRAMIILG